MTGYVAGDDLQHLVTSFDDPASGYKHVGRAQMDTLEETPAPYPSIWQSFLIAGIVILMTIACGPVLLLGSWIGDEAAAMVYYATAFGLNFYIVHSIRQRRLGPSKYNFRIGSWRLILPLVLGSIALLFGVVAPIQSLIPMPESMQQSLRTAVGATGLPTFAYFVLAAPLLEELIFRGIMLDGLLKQYKPFTSIVISSLLFGFVHLNPWQFVTGFVMGCLLGWVYFRSGSVGACILIHMSANFSGYLCRLFVDFDAPGNQQGGIVDAYGGSVARLVAVHATLLIVFTTSVLFLRHEFDKEVSSRQENYAA
jgi:uncharacterized protein